MRWQQTVRSWLTAAALSAVCWAQSTTQPSSATKPADAPCAEAKPASAQGSGQNSQSNAQSRPCAASATPESAPKSAAEQFPFPGEPGQPEAPAAASPAPNAPVPSAASQHPFPGEPPAADSGAGSSSSSSSDDDNYNPNAPLPSTLKKQPSPFTKVQTPDQRVDEDLRVASFYMDNDNLPGAYLRAKDAVKTEPDYSETHYMLAQVLQKMKKKDEATAEYKAYLK